VSNTFSEKLTSSRGIGVALGIGAAVLAGLLLLVYLHQYRSSVSGDNAPTSVIVAKALIPQGTSGTIIGAKALYQTTTLPKQEVKVGAVADPAFINGRVAVSDILPGQQLTSADFTEASTTSVNTKITGPQRGVSVPVDAIRMSTTQVFVGDKIDLYVAVGGEVKLFEPSVKVLAVPDQGAVGGSYILRVNTRVVPVLMVAADSGTLWAAIRPQAGAKPTADTKASLQTLKAK
jgi:Flp pilus assembly protein CpaB